MPDQPFSPIFEKNLRADITPGDHTIKYCSLKNMKLTKVERFILDFISKENPDPELLAQIESLGVASREHTGVGLYSNFEFSDRDKARRISSPSVPYPGPNLTSPELEHGAGSVVWCGDDGFLSCIEIFSYSDHYPEGEYEFSIMPEEAPETNQANMTAVSTAFRRESPSRWEEK